LAKALATRLERAPGFLEAILPHLEELKELESKIQIAGRDFNQQHMSNTGDGSVNVQSTGSSHNINIQR